MMKQQILSAFLLSLILAIRTQELHSRLGPMQEVFAWTQLTFEENGQIVEEDAPDVTMFRSGSEPMDQVFFNNDEILPLRPWERPSSSNIPYFTRPTTGGASSSNTNNEEGRHFIQYNNVPMGMERVGDRLFVSLPRRRFGIPATLNYIDLNEHANTRSPPLRPYPDPEASKRLLSVYRTRADGCGRLWMVDTGLMELPNNPRQVQQPAVVVYDLNTNRQILRYELKNITDLPAANTPTGLASITVDIVNGDCSNAFAYIPDLTTFGIVVYSLRENDSWRHSHNFFSYTPTAGNLHVSGQDFQWSDGIFSITLGDRSPDGCRPAFFHPLISFQEFSVSTCVLRNKTAMSSRSYYTLYNYLGERGPNSQSTIHDYHPATKVIFYADIGRDAISCWNTRRRLTPSNVAVLAQDEVRMSYPADLHVTGDEVWTITNALPKYGYSRLNTNEYNFFIYKGQVAEMIRGTPCDNRN